MKNLDLPPRTVKPRRHGITHVLDKGLGINAAKDLVDTAKDYIDILKFGWGTGIITPNIEEKVNLYKDAGIRVCFGGTLFEYMYINSQLEEYEAWLKELRVDLIEISDGTIQLRLKEKVKLIERFAKSFDVLSEVGSKDKNIMADSHKWSEEIKIVLNSGVSKVITEGRESGTVGIFRNSGEVKEELIDEILHDVSFEDLIFEAPNKNQQVWFIKQFGPNVNLGNIASNEVISVETLRLGLRGDTFLHFHKGAKE